MPKKDKKSPVSICHNCGKPITLGLPTCQYCGFLLLPSPPPRPVPQPPAYSRLPYQSETRHTDTPKQARKTGDKIRTTTGKEDADAELYKLNKGAAKAQIVTAIVLSVTLFAAILGAIIAYIDYNTARIEYEARTKPDLFIENIEFNETSDNTTHLLINVTNFGDRPARNIQFEDILVCAVSEEGCTIIHGAADENQEDIIVYPGRVRTVRIIIEEKDYPGISKTDKLVVKLEYRYGNEEYWYQAELKIHQDDNKWQVEKEQSN